MNKEQQLQYIQLISSKDESASFLNNAAWSTDKKELRDLERNLGICTVEKNGANGHIQYL